MSGIEIIIGNSPSRERTERGKSILAALNDYVALDLETTGLDPRFDDIIECAAIKVSNGEVVDRYESLVNPGYEIDGFITNLTGITNEMLSTARSIVDVLPEFLDFIGDSVVVAHNANFDINFLYDKAEDFFEKAFKNDFIDTMRFSRRLFPEQEHHRLQDLKSRLLNDNSDVQHRGASDAECAALCYEKMCEYCAENDIDVAKLGARRHWHATEISTQKTVFNEFTPVFGKVFAFTGTLGGCTRREAMQMVVDLGGIVGDGVTQKTNYLVLGEQDYKKVGESGKSSKQNKADKLRLGGQDIETISENVFFDMIRESEEE